MKTNVKDLAAILATAIYADGVFDEAEQIALDEIQEALEIDKAEFENAMKLQSSDNRCPILCLLKSNALQYEQKKTILEKILEKYNFEITPVIGLEMRNRNFESLLKKYKKNVNY